MTDLEMVQRVHDLRNQVTIMVLCTHVIGEDLPDDHASTLKELQHSADRALQLANGLLADARPHPSVGSVVDLNEVVQQTVPTLSRLADDVIRLELDLSTQPVRVAAEPGALERVLLNLALNARDAMPDGGVLTIETAVAYTRGRPIEAVPPGPFARLRLSDTGCGMTSEVKHRMFDAFFTTKENGTGLGLRSVAATVQQLQGRISVESEPGRGTSVTIMLPLATERTGAGSSRYPADARD